MFPFKPFRYTQGHDVKGKIYKLKIDNLTDEEVYRKPTNKRVIWEGEANFGIKAYKRHIRQPKFGYTETQINAMVKKFKEMAWDSVGMREQIAKGALHAKSKDLQRDNDKV